jgi:hypothetical protein
MMITGLEQGQDITIALHQSVDQYQLTRANGGSPRQRCKPKRAGLLGCRHVEVLQREPGSNGNVDQVKFKMKTNMKMDEWRKQKIRRQTTAKLLLLLGADGAEFCRSAGAVRIAGSSRSLLQSHQR